MERVPEFNVESDAADAHACHLEPVLRARMTVLGISALRKGGGTMPPDISLVGGAGFATPELEVVHRPVDTPPRPLRAAGDLPHDAHVAARRPARLRRQERLPQPEHVLPARRWRCG
jgi:hypothetical protein